MFCYNTIVFSLSLLISTSTIQFCVYLCLVQSSAYFQAITYKLGEKVEVHFSGMWTGWFVGYIEEKNDDGTYAVVFEEGSRYNFIPPKRIREVNDYVA